MLLKLSAPAAYGAVAHEKRRHAKTAIYKRKRQREVLE